MGDESENVYETIRPLGSTVRFGLRRPEGIKVSQIPETLRHAPDYFTVTHLVECMGMGRDDILKSLKVSKYEALKQWQKIAKQLGLMGVMLFVWSSHHRRFLVINWENVVEEVSYSKKKYGVQTFENDGVQYYRLDWNRLADKAIIQGAHEPQ